MQAPIDIRQLTISRPVIVGILNTTPDSFSDGGLHDNVERAVAHARRMVDEGADWIDVGGESTRPGAARIDAAEQRRRVVGVIERIAGELGVVVSVDTTRAEVAAAALDAGATVINDVSAGLESGGATLALAAERGAGVVLMHMRGEPGTMQDDPRYGDVVSEVADFLLERAAAAERAGVPADRIAIDPGIGFGKTAEHNLALLGNLDLFAATGYAVMLGTSRKRFLGALAGGAAVGDPAQRTTATAATTALGVAAGVRLFRVHDVRANREAADVTAAVVRHRMGGRDDEPGRAGPPA